MKRSLARVLVVLLVVFVVIQFLPADRSNPAVEEEISTSPQVQAILRRACYDCHSNETIWPGYSRVAPISWLVAWDVRRGRKELNFSTWNRYTQKKRHKKMKESWEEVEEGEMPPWFYLPLHLEAQLSSEDRRVLQDWAASVPSDSDNEDLH